MAETKNLERSGIRQKSFVGAEQRQTFKKIHIKQLPVHFVENVADKKKPSVGENLQPQGSGMTLPPVYLCWSFPSLRSSK